MNIGFHTNAYVWAGLNDLEQIADLALEQRFTCLEIGPGITLDQKVFERVGQRISYSAFIYCRNFIDDDEQTAEEERRELWKRMEFAAAVGAKKMICSTGISRELSLPDSGGCDPLKSKGRALEFLHQAVEHAQELGLTLCLENCPMYRNIATSPYMWEEIFSEFSPEELGLCYDPSHFVWQMIDVYEPLERFADRIYHIHLKDTLLMREKLAQVGILHNTAKERGFEKNQWWRHTLIGEGEINWKRFLDGVKKLPSPLLDVSFEQEDCNYEGEPEKVSRGMGLQRQRLELLM